MLRDLRLPLPALSLADNALAHGDKKQLEGGSGGRSAARRGPHIPDPQGSGGGGPGGALCGPKMLRLFWSRRPPQGSARIAAEPQWGGSGAPPRTGSRAGLGGMEGGGRQPLWRSPRPPGPLRALRGEMSSGGSGSCHCCPWERGWGRDAPLFSPGAAEPRACEAAPAGAASPVRVWGEAPGAARRGGGRAPAGLALPPFGLVHREGLWWGEGVTPEPPPRGAGPRRQPPARSLDLQGGTRGCHSHGAAAPALPGSVACSALLTKHAVPQGQGISPRPRSPEEPRSRLPPSLQLHLLPGSKLISFGSPMTPGAGALGSMCRSQHG